MSYETTTRLLLIEDSEATASVYCAYLNETYSVSVEYKGQDGLNALKSQRFDIVVIDVQLPDMSGLDILREIQVVHASLPVVVITAHGSVEIAVEAMQIGAADFLTKPIDKPRLLHTLSQVLKTNKLSHLVETYEKTFERTSFHNMIGSSLSMQAVYRIIESASPSRASVFITGESGTGKELSAEAIHQESPRREKPFVALNCAAIPTELMESEVFGHIKGAFSGAHQNRDGAAQRAHGGTLFLDEIGEMPLSLQSKLLRLIQSGTFQPVGSNEEIKVDVRFVCATNRDPLDEVNAGRFREDLYYRLNVIPIHMPALRDRGSDILRLASVFLESYSEEEGKGFKYLSDSLCEKLTQHSWPGNVRELSNVIRNAIVLNNGTTLGLEHLPNSFLQIQSKNLIKSKARPQIATNLPVQSEATAILPLWMEEKKVIERAIEYCQGNIPKAAAMLDISASTVYRKKQGWEEN